MNFGLMLGIITAARPEPPEGTAPENLTEPVIAGGPTVGSTLTSTPGTWSGSPSITRQWRRNDTDIPGATGTSLATASYADGDIIILRETGTNANGTASADSNSITLTAAAGDPIGLLLTLTKAS